jgi:TolB-like protein
MMRRRRLVALAGALLLGVAAAACNDGLLYDAAGPRDAQLAILPLLGTAAGGVLDAYGAADRIAISFVAAGNGETRLAETLPFDGSAAEVQLSVQVPLRAETETFVVHAELRRGTDPLFRGSAAIEITTGGSTPIELPLTPVVAAVVCAGDVIVLDALGATAPLTAAALFATGDTLPDQVIAWTSSAASIASVAPTGSAAAVVSAVADGQATIRCGVGELSDTRAVQVAPVVARVTVTPAEAVLAPGETLQFAALLHDRLNNVLTGHPITWQSGAPAVASISAAGLATALATGSTRIVATSGTAADSATLSVSSLPPLAVTGESTPGTGPTGAPLVVLNGTVNPRGAATQAWFEYGTSATLVSFSSTSAQGVGAGSAEVDVSHTVEQLQPNTTYYYRMAASNTHGTARGQIRSFTLATPPSATTLPAEPAPGVVMLRGQANPQGLATQTWFEYGTSPTLTTFSSTSVVSVGNGFSNVSVEREVFELEPETDYYARLVAQNQAGTTRGGIVQFRIPAGGLPDVETVDAVQNQQRGFTLMGWAVPNGAPTEVWFEFSYGDPQLIEHFTTEPELLDGGFTGVDFTADIPFETSLFWFRAVASNEFGTAYGAIQEVYAFGMANWGRPMIPHRSLRLLALLLSGLLLPMAAAAQQRSPDTRPGIAVLPFERGISIGVDRAELDALSVGVQQILITELAQNPALRVVDRSVVRDLMAEQDLGATGRVDAETAARIGRMVGARYVVTGGFNDADGNFRLDGRIVDVETTEVLKADQVTDRRSNLYAIIMSLGERLSQGVELPALPREVRSERQSRGATIPREAVVLYSQAQFFADRGQTDRARELYRRITTEFPQMTEAQEALRQIGTAGT